MRKSQDFRHLARQSVEVEKPAFVPDIQRLQKERRKIGIIDLLQQLLPGIGAFGDPCQIDDCIASMYCIWLFS